MTAPSVRDAARPPVPTGLPTAAAWSWRLLSAAAGLYVLALLVGRLSLVFTTLAVGLAVTVGALLAGVVGAVVAVPLMASTSAAGVHLSRQRAHGPAPDVGGAS